MKNLREKIDNNETIQFIKSVWSNKKTRSWIGLGIYFVFFLILSIMMRSADDVDTPNRLEEVEKKSDIASIILNLENTSKNNYQYKILIDNKELIGNYQNGNNSFTYDGYKYIYVYDKLYKENSLNLELVDNLLSTDIPIEYITLDKILYNIKNKNSRSDSIINLDFKIYYDISSLDFLNINSDKLIEICLVGSDNQISKITLNYINNNYVLEIN